MFLRIRPAECRGTQGLNITGGDSKAPSRGKINNKGIERRMRTACLNVNSPSSVTLNAPPSAPDSKRSKTEIYDGFSHVFPPDSLQEDIYDKVMKPVVKDFMEGHSSLLVGMGPTGSGKTYTMFGSLQQLGIVPIALRQIFSQKTVNENTRTSRTYYLSMFEIHSERGKGEKIFDLSPDSTDNTHPQTSIISVKEVKVTTFADAENIVKHGISKRSTAPTNANNQSSRSQCIVNVRCAVKNDPEDSSVSNAVLTIADLAGAERERKTGNQGARLLESNFINNTSMVFGLCLRSLLVHQKNPKKPVEKHFKNSLLTRYLQDYMEGKKRMTLILTVKAAEEDYMETSSILRQASPYMKIKFNHLDEIKNAPCKKRSPAVITAERSKRRKVNNSEASLTDVNHVMKDATPTTQIFERDSAAEDCIGNNCTADFKAELQKIKRSEEVMRNFARAFWSMLKQCKHKLKETENEVRFLKDSLREQSTQSMELEKELKGLRNSCSCLHKVTIGECAKGLPFSHSISMPPISSNPDLSHDNGALLAEYCEIVNTKKPENESQFLKDTELEKELKESTISSSCLHNPPVEECDKAESFNPAICVPPISLNPDLSLDNDALPDEYHTLMTAETSGETEMDRDTTTLDISLFNTRTTGDIGMLSFPVHQGVLQQEEGPSDTCSSLILEEAKELNFQYSDENSENCQKVAHSEMPVGRMDVAVMNFSEAPSSTVELGGEGRFSLFPGNEETSVMKVEKEQLIVAVSEKAQQITKSHATEALRNEDEDPALRTLNSERPKRKLLPASKMLLKDFSDLVMDENVKEIKHKKAATLEGRSQGSNSLIRILKSNLPR